MGDESGGQSAVVQLPCAMLSAARALVRQMGLWMELEVASCAVHAMQGR